MKKILLFIGILLFTNYVFAAIEQIYLHNIVNDSDADVSLYLKLGDVINRTERMAPHSTKFVFGLGTGQTDIELPAATYVKISATGETKSGHPYSNVYSFKVRDLSQFRNRDYISIIVDKEHNISIKKVPSK